MNASIFVEALKDLRFENAFNPYVDSCSTYDLPNAAEVRCDNLRTVLDAALSSGVSSVWIGRDLGYRGGRRTGLALTDEVHLACHAGLYRDVSLSQATHGPATGERTATILWSVLKAVGSPVFLWNVVPLHPHLPGNPLSNRCHTRAEREASLPLLLWILEALRPMSVIAIGRDAQVALQRGGVAADAVRHPSYGGQRDFLEAMNRRYGLTAQSQRGVNVR